MLLKHKSRKKVTTVTITSKYEISPGIILTVVEVDGVNKSQRIVSHGKVEYKLVKDGEMFRQLVKENLFYQIIPKGRDLYWWDEQIEKHPLESLSSKDFNPRDLISIDNYSHSFLDIDGKFLDMLVQSDYIEGFRQQSRDDQTNWDWTPLVEYLSAHPSVIRAEEKDIPYYNSDFYGQKGLELDFIFKSEWRQEGEDSWNWKSVIKGESDPLKIRKFELLPSKKDKKKKFDD